jgi:hypothetical protein
MSPRPSRNDARLEFGRWSSDASSLTEFANATRLQHTQQLLEDKMRIRDQQIRYPLLNRYIGREPAIFTPTAWA